MPVEDKQHTLNLWEGCCGSWGWCSNTDTLELLFFFIVNLHVRVYVNIFVRLLP